MSVQSEDLFLKSASARSQALTSQTVRCPEVAHKLAGSTLWEFWFRALCSVFIFPPQVLENLQKKGTPQTLNPKVQKPKLKRKLEIL